MSGRGWGWCHMVLITCLFVYCLFTVYWCPAVSPGAAASRLLWLRAGWRLPVSDRAGSCRMCRVWSGESLRSRGRGAPDRAGTLGDRQLQRWPGRLVTSQLLNAEEKLSTGHHFKWCLVWTSEKLFTGYHFILLHKIETGRFRGDQVTVWSLKRI